MIRAAGAGRSAEPPQAAVPLPEPVPEEPALLAKAAAAAPNGAAEPMLDDLDVPAILRSKRRSMVQ